MNGEVKGRLARLQEWLRPVCRTCYGHAYAVVLVPFDADETDPEWNPTHCPECGIPLRNIQQIINISDEEMSDPLESAG